MVVGRNLEQTNKQKTKIFKSWTNHQRKKKQKTKNRNNQKYRSGKKKKKRARVLPADFLTFSSLRLLRVLSTQGQTHHSYCLCLSTITIVHNYALCT